MHDLGVFVGHRPRDLKALARWNHVAYAERKVPGLLRRFGFPPEKIPAVMNAIHAATGKPMRTLPLRNPVEALAKA